MVEQSAVVWHSSLTMKNRKDIERVQKVALRTILKDDYTDYSSALQLCSLISLKDRRQHLCKSFAKKCTKSEKTSDMFPLRKNIHHIRHPEKYVVFPANTKRLANSAIPYMQRLLNSD